MTEKELEQIRNLKMGEYIESGDYRVRRIVGGVILSEIFHLRTRGGTECTSHVGAGVFIPCDIRSFKNNTPRPTL
jgi:hypothetical protein